MSKRTPSHPGPPRRKACVSSFVSTARVFFPLSRTLMFVWSGRVQRGGPPSELFFVFFWFRDGARFFFVGFAGKPRKPNRGLNFFPPSLFTARICFFLPGELFGSGSWRAWGSRGKQPRRLIFLYTPAAFFCFPRAGRVQRAGQKRPGVAELVPAPRGRGHAGVRGVSNASRAEPRSEGESFGGLARGISDYVLAQNHMGGFSKVHFANECKKRVVETWLICLASRMRTMGERRETKTNTFTGC